MTNPILSISTTEKIGRLYQVPGDTFEKKISGGKARNGLETNRLFPSITNIIGAVNPDLEGYVAHMFTEAILKGEPLDVARKAHITYRDATADRGTLVHGFIEDFINSGLPYPFEDVTEEADAYDDGLGMPMDNDYINSLYTGGNEYKTLPIYREILRNQKESGLEHLKYIDAFFAFSKKFRPTYIAQEATVYGRTIHGKTYAGTTDFIATIDGKTIVGDWKTTSKLKDTVALQLAAVAKATKMTTDFVNFQPMVEADEIWGVQLMKDGYFTVKKATDVNRAFEAFSAAREIWGLTSGTEAFLGGV